MAVPTSSQKSVKLPIHEKATTTIDLYSPIRRYICTKYSSSVAESLDSDLKSINQLRSDLQKHSSLETRRDILLSYYGALDAVSLRFPISPDPAHISTISFTWHDAFKPSKKASRHDIHFEKAAVLFNIGAVYSQIAVAADREDITGLKTACNSFQNAAGAFAFLRDNEAVKASLGGGVTVDVSVDCAGMLERLMLAQAQECFFEKVIRDGKSHGLCSKVAQQVAIYYDEAQKALYAPSLNQHFDRTWMSLLQLKTAQFFAEAYYRVGLDLHEKEEIGEEITRLKVGISVLSDAKKSARGVSQFLLDVVARLESNMSRNLERAVKENDRVYLMRVPEPDMLAPLPAASLVKPTAFSESLDVCRSSLFASLVPESCTKALSNYTEMVNNIIQNQSEKLQQESDTVRVKLKEMELPDFLSLEGNFSIPQNLREDVTDVQVVGGPSGLETELQQLRDLRKVNQQLLDETMELLKMEEREDRQLRIKFGARWTRPQSSILTENLHEKLNSFAANLKQAAESDAVIECSIKNSSAIMDILDYQPIESAFPCLTRPRFSLDGSEEATKDALKRSLMQLEALDAHRTNLEDRLNEIKAKDDMLPKLMAITGSYDDLFKTEVSKYDHVCDEISQNIEAQENLLLQIQAQKDAFAATFNVEDYKVSLEKSCDQIRTAIAKFREIKENVNEGLKFYVTLQDGITNVKQLCSDFVMCRKLECEGMV